MAINMTGVSSILFSLINDAIAMSFISSNNYSYVIYIRNTTNSCLLIFNRYTFYDGPPFATGLPHYGHILVGTIKDVVTRWAHQSGFHVERRFGWDCHGLPVVSVVRI